MRGRGAAMMVASTLAMLSLILPPVSIVSSAAVALVSLRRGAYEGLYVLLCSSLAAAVLGWFVLGSYQFGLIYGAVLWMPIWLISIVLREGRYLSLAIEMAVLLGAVGVVIFYLYTDSPAAIWDAMLLKMVEPMVQATPDVAIEEMQQSLGRFSHYMTGVVSAGAVYGLLFGLFLGRWWQSVLYNPGGFRQEFLALGTKPRLAIISLAVVVFAWLTTGTLSEIAWNISILLFVLYTFIGISVVHAVFARMKAARFLVPFLYLALFMIPHVMLPVALVGLLDTWLNLRNRISNKTSA